MDNLETAINYTTAFSMRVLNLMPHTEIGVDVMCSDFVVPAKYASIAKGIDTYEPHEMTIEPNGDLYIWRVPNSGYIYGAFTGNFLDWMKQCLSVECPDVERREWNWWDVDEQ